MPGRLGDGPLTRNTEPRGGGVQLGQQYGKYDPCNNPRPITDPAGRLSDLINCYAMQIGDKIRIALPLTVLAIVLLFVMYIAANQFLKE